MGLDKEKLHDYTARVSQANRSELVVIILEAFLDSVEEGKKLLQEDEAVLAGREIKRARGFLTELMGSLDFHYAVSHYLRRLYVYSYHELCQGMALRDVERLEHAEGPIRGLLPAFREVAKQDDSAPLMENTEPIYAGLTYGRNQLNESIGVNVSGNRGFEA